MQVDRAGRFAGGHDVPVRREEDEAYDLPGRAVSPQLLAGGGVPAAKRAVVARGQHRLAVRAKSRSRGGAAWPAEALLSLPVSRSIRRSDGPSPRASSLPSGDTDRPVLDRAARSGPATPGASALPTCRSFLPLGHVPHGQRVVADGQHDEELAVRREDERRAWPSPPSSARASLPAATSNSFTLAPTGTATSFASAEMADSIAGADPSPRAGVRDAAQLLAGGRVPGDDGGLDGAVADLDADLHQRLAVGAEGHPVRHQAAGGCRLPERAQFLAGRRVPHGRFLAVDRRHQRLAVAR